MRKICASSKCARDGVVDRARRGQVVAERLLQHHARLRASIRPARARLAQIAGEQAGRGGQVVHAVRARPARARPGRGIAGGLGWRRGRRSSAGARKSVPGVAVAQGFGSMKPRTLSSMKAEKASRPQSWRPTPMMRVPAGRLPCRCAMYSAGSSLRTDRSPAPPNTTMSSGTSDSPRPLARGPDKDCRRSSARSDLIRCSCMLASSLMSVASAGAAGDSRVGIQRERRAQQGRRLRRADHLDRDRCQVGEKRPLASKRARNGGLREPSAQPRHDAAADVDAAARAQRQRQVARGGCRERRRTACSASAHAASLPRERAAATMSAAAGRAPGRAGVSIARSARCMSTRPWPQTARSAETWPWRTPIAPSTACSRGVPAASVTWPPSPCSGNQPPRPSGTRPETPRPVPGPMRPTARRAPPRHRRPAAARRAAAPAAPAPAR